MRLHPKGKIKNEDAFISQFSNSLRHFKIMAEENKLYTIWALVVCVPHSRALLQYVSGWLGNIQAWCEGHFTRNHVGL